MLQEMLMACLDELEKMGAYKPVSLGSQAAAQKQGVSLPQAAAPSASPAALQPRSATSASKGGLSYSRVNVKAPGTNLGTTLSGKELPPPPVLA